MNPTKRVLLLFVLLAACLPMSGCDDLNKTKQSCERIIIYSDIGLKAVGELRVADVLDASASEDLTRAITHIRLATQVFLDRANGYEKFDVKSKADLGRLFVDVTSGIGELQRVGIIHFKDPEVAKRFTTVMTVLTTASRLIETRLK
jgi:hypothetical protein